MMKVVWLSQYNIVKLLPIIKLNKQLILHSSSWIHTLSNQIAERAEVELHIITHTNIVSETQSFIKDKIHFHIIKYRFPFTDRGFPWYFPIDKLTGYYSFSRAARKLLKQIHPDIIHVHGTEGGYFVPAYRSNVPCIISMQGIIREIVKVSPSIRGYSQIPYERFAIRKGKHFGCRTHFDSAFVKGINKDAQIFDLPEAINKIFFEHKWQVKDKLTLLFVGSIMKRKGIEDLLECVWMLKDKYPTINLRVVGSGKPEYIRYLNKFILNRNLQSSVLWLGTKESNEIAEELVNCTFFVLPSLADNSPNALAEAMAVGVPCIATDVGGIPSMVDDGVDGMLFRKGDISHLTRIIKELVDNAQLQQQLSENSRKKAYGRNYPSIVTNRYIETYKSLLK